MRKLVPLAALAVLLPGAAGASTACQPPKVNGFTVYAVNETGIGCHYANEVVVNYLRNRLHGYTCTHRFAGSRTVHTTCTQDAHAAYTVHFSYYVH